MRGFRISLAGALQARILAANPCKQVVKLGLLHAHLMSLPTGILRTSLKLIELIMLLPIQLCKLIRRV